MIYFSCFLLSILFAYLFKIGLIAKSLRFFPYVVSLLIPILLAALRDSGVGTDTQIYVDYVWKDICSTNSISLFISRLIDNYYAATDWGYLIINYLASYLSNDVHIIYFFISVVIFVFIGTFAIENQKKASIPIVLFLFYFCFYNQSLNLMRQSMAMSCCVYGYKFIERGKWIPLLLTMLVSISFHATGIIFIVICGANRLLKIKNRITKFAIVIVLLLAFFALLNNFNELLAAVIDFGVIPAHYAMYEAMEEGVFQTSLLVMYGTFELCFLLAWLSVGESEKKSEILYFSLFHFFAILISLLSIISYEAYRISLYFFYISILVFLPRTLYWVKKSNISLYKSMMLLVITISIITWFYVIVVRGDTETYPYASKLLGI